MDLDFKCHRNTPETKRQTVTNVHMVLEWNKTLTHGWFKMAFQFVGVVTNVFFKMQ